MRVVLMLNFTSWQLSTSKYKIKQYMQLEPRIKTNRKKTYESRNLKHVHRTISASFVCPLKTITDKSKNQIHPQESMIYSCYNLILCYFSSFNCSLLSYNILSWQLTRSKISWDNHSHHSWKCTFPKARTSNPS